MKAILPLLLCLGAAELLAQDLPTSPIVEKQAQSVRLSWSGGTAPYQIQRSLDLQQWEPLGTAPEPSFVLPDAVADAAFFRVQGTPDLGNYLGQWRVAEGEFGNALAKHRLKSIWEFYFPEGERITSAKTLFTESTLKLSYLKGGAASTFIGKLAELPKSTIDIEDRKMTVSWQWGDGASQRDLALTLTFPYTVTSVRFSTPNLSDPSITLSADYALPQTQFDDLGKRTTVKNEEVSLVEVDDQGDRPGWWDRSMSFTEGGVTIDSSFGIGVPLFEGSPAFIFKTPLLVSWDTTTITGLTSKPIVLSDRFSQTYFPFHHNFVETLWVEPALAPGIDPEILAELEAQDIRFIVPQNPSAFPNQDPSLQVVGFDWNIRQL